MSIFQRRLDILIFIAHADHEVSRAELQEYVTDLTQPVLNDALGVMVSEGFLIPLHARKNRRYLPTEKTLQIFGVVK